MAATAAMMFTCRSEDAKARRNNAARPLLRFARPAGAGAARLDVRQNLPLGLYLVDLVVCYDERVGSVFRQVQRPIAPIMCRLSSVNGSSLSIEVGVGEQATCL